MKQINCVFDLKSKIICGIFVGICLSDIKDEKWKNFKDKLEMDI